MKSSIFAAFAVLSSAVVAESQANGVAEASADSLPTNSVAAVNSAIDEIALADDEGGKIELTVDGKGVARQVNIVCEDATISEVLREFRKVVKANIISTESTNLNRRVSISLYNTPWLDSLKAVLGMGGFVLDERNGIYFVAEEQSESPIIRTKSFTLNHASAEDLVKLLNESLGEKDRKTGKLVSPVATSFRDANVVVVKGNDKLIRDCEDIIMSVDRAPEQVYIEARFIELSNQAKHDLGIKWDSLENYQVTLKDVRYGIESNRGQLGNYGYKQPNNTYSHTRDSSWSSSRESSESSDRTTAADGSVSGSSSSGSSSQSSSSRSGGLASAIGSTVSSLIPSEIPESTALLDTVGGTEQARSMQWANAQAFSGQLSADAFALTLSAFEKMSDIKMFSNPRIIVSNGKQAQVDMTTKYPNVRVTSNRTGGISDSLDITAQLEQIPGEEGGMFAKDVFFSWGISLFVTPRISPNGLINVNIEPMISDLNAATPWAEVNGGENSAYSKYPVIDMQRLKTDFTMKDGSTAVIGGLTRTVEEDVDSGIPYLRKIPWIGPRLFGWKSRSKVQKEIIVFVTVGIANPRNLEIDVGLPKNAVLGREYVEGRALEPGDRGGVHKSMELDMNPVEDRYAPKAEESDEGEQTSLPVEADAAPDADHPVKRVAPVESPAPAPTVPAEPEAVGPAKVTTPPVSDQAGPSKEFVSDDSTEDADSPRKLRHGRAK